jgi:hypothetical protein
MTRWTPEQQAEIFRQKLKDWALRRLSSLRELDRRTGHAPNYWSQVFRGKPRMTIDHLFELLAAADADLPALLTEIVGPQQGAVLQASEATLAEMRHLITLMREIGDTARRLEGAELFSRK